VVDLICGGGERCAGMARDVGASKFGLEWRTQEKVKVNWRIMIFCIFNGRAVRLYYACRLRIVARVV
jgi:hypothetical protein